MYQKIIENPRSLETIARAESFLQRGTCVFCLQRTTFCFITVNLENSTVSIVRILYGDMDIRRQLEDSPEIK